jgi:hypothetical protein
MDDMTMRAARRAALDPYFLAFALHQYAEQHEMDEAALAAALGATPETLAHARLCRTPRTDDPAGCDGVSRIAVKFGLNEAELLKAVRAGEVAVAHRAAAERGRPETAAPMLAARDRLPDEPRPPGNGE